MAIDGKVMNRTQDRFSLGATIVALLVLTGTVSLLYVPLFL